MTLPTTQSDLFYAIWFPLLLFVNRQRQLVPALFDAGPSAKLPIPDALIIRQALWEDDALLNAFITENPAQLSAGYLDLAASWKRRRAGNFFIYKHLKKLSIFIEDGSKEVFAVKGLYSPIEAVAGPYLPVLVKTVLLPFGDEIIYDGLMQSYNVEFGSGIRSNLKDRYDDAKERGAILTRLAIPGQSVLPANQAAQATTTNAKVLRAFQKYLYKSGQSVKIADRDMATIAALAEQTLPLSLRDFTENSINNYLASLPATGRGAAITGLKRFIKFMLETGRLEWDEAEDLLLFLKGE